jgi:hypothetical protein
MISSALGLEGVTINVLGIEVKKMAASASKVKG